jgi:hypothetical protein
LQDPTDYLSKTGRTILDLDPQAYSALVPQTHGIAQARDILESTQPADLVTGPVNNRDEARALLSALWLWHDYLDESHTISQKIDTPTGSFWHAIMHRREGDFSNSKYWYARCTFHPALATLGAQAGAIVHPHPADKSLLRIVMTGFNPNAWVDLVQEVHTKPNDPRHKLAVQLQQIEFRVLFQHCTRAAVGS